MALNRDFVGRRCRSSEPVEVTRGDIRRFATAIGDEHPLYLEVAAARERGHRDVVAPPTFLVTASGGLSGQLIHDPDLGLDYSMVVHGEQGFQLHRPVYAGDVLDVEARIESIREAGRNELIALVTDFTSGDERVATVTSTVVSRGTATGAA
jgi:acyl dehydratase